MIKRDKLIFWLVVLVLFLAIYFPPLKILFVSPEYLLIFLGFIWSIFHFEWFLNAFFKKSILLFLTIQIVIILYAKYTDTVNNHAERMDLISLYYFKQLRLLTNAVFICLSLAVYLHHKNWSVDKLLKAFVVVGIIQGILATLMLILPSIKNFLLSFMNLTFLEESKEGIFTFRVFGLSSEYLFAYPIFQGFVLMIIFLEIINKRYKYIKYVPFILVSIVFNARIGLFALPSVFLVYFFYLRAQKNTFKLFFKFFRILFFAIFFLIICAFITIQIVGYDNFESIFFRGLNSGMSEGHLYTLFNKMIYWPSTYAGFIFGEGRYLFGNEYDVKSDLGYINDLLFGGVIYIFCYFFNIKKILSINMNNVNINYKILITSAFLLMLICNFKGSILTNNGFIRALLILVFLHILNSKDRNLIKTRN